MYLKNKTFYSKALTENSLLLITVSNSNLTYGCHIWIQDQNEGFKKIEKLQGKAIRIVNFPP